MKHQFTVAVVTGAGAGLGRAIALQLARQGCAVGLGDIDPEGLAETAEQVRALGGRALTEPCDVRQTTDLERLWDASEQAFGPVDLLVNNAGVAVAGEIGTTTPADWAWILDINLMGVVHGCQLAAPRFSARQRGCILNIASAAGLVSMPGMGPYNVSKAGVVALTQTLRGELRAAGVGVTVACPTFFPTSLLSDSRGMTERETKGAQALMNASGWTAADVAQRILKDTAAGQLYAVPMWDGWFGWFAHRVAPGLFYDLLPRFKKRMEKRTAAAAA